MKKLHGAIQCIMVFVRTKYAATRLSLLLFVKIPLNFSVRQILIRSCEILHFTRPNVLQNISTFAKSVIRNTQWNNNAISIISHLVNTNLYPVLHLIPTVGWKCPMWTDTPAIYSSKLKINTVHVSSKSWSTYWLQTHWPWQCLCLFHSLL